MTWKPEYFREQKVLGSAFWRRAVVWGYLKGAWFGGVGGSGKGFCRFSSPSRAVCCGSPCPAPWHQAAVWSHETPASSRVPGRKEWEEGGGQVSRQRLVGGWQIEKQTLFSAGLWREGSCGPQARRVKQFQTGMSVCFSLEQRVKTPKALGFSSLNILFEKCSCERVEEMKTVLNKWKRPLPSLTSRPDGKPHAGWMVRGRWAGGHLRTKIQIPVLSGVFAGTGAI